MDKETGATVGEAFLQAHVRAVLQADVIEAIAAGALVQAAQVDACGEMIKEVSFDGTVFNDAPHKFEAGTPNIAGFIGLGVAADYLQQLGQENVEAREAELLAHFTEELRRVDGLRIIGEAPEKAAVVSFLIDGAHAHDLATLLDLEGVAVRSGQHCAHPLLQYFGVAATCRASLAFYNTHAEIERFMTALTKVRKLLG